MSVPQLLPGVDLPEVGPLEEFYITMPEIPSHTVVLQHISERASSKAPARRDPFWVTLCVWLGALAMLVSGLALVALGSWMRFTS